MYDNSVSFHKLNLRYVYFALFVVHEAYLLIL